MKKCKKGSSQTQYSQNVNGDHHVYFGTDHFFVTDVSCLMYSFFLQNCQKLKLSYFEAHFLFSFNHFTH